jgi:ferric-dicitrate binding protein FerR (iron transport regulator)
MDKSVDNRISELITRHCLGVITSEEEAELQSWRSASEPNEKTFNRICSSDFVEQGLQHAYRSDEEHQRQKDIVAKRISRIRLRRRLVRYSSAAAVIIVALAVLMFIPGKKENYPVIEYQSVVLKLPSGERIELDKEETNLLSEKTTVPKEESSSDMPAPEEYTIIVPAGRTHKLVLSDGSKVTLNSNSEITYSVPFSGKERRVAFKGEAWFEISKDASRPFILSTGGLNVEVLGTSFAVRSDLSEVRTTLVTGSVKVTDAYRGLSLILEPSQQALYSTSDGKLTSQEVNVDEYIAWKDGYWYFDNRPLGYIIEELSKNYGFEYEFADKELEDLPFSFKLKREFDYIQVLKIIEKTNRLKIYAYKDKIIIEK